MTTPKIFNHLLICMYLYQHAKNQLSRRILEIRSILESRDQIGRTHLVVVLRAFWCTSHPKPKKQKNPPQKNSLYFWKSNFLALIFLQKKAFLIFSQKKAFLIFSQKKTFLIFSRKKTFLIFLEM